MLGSPPFLSSRRSQAIGPPSVVSTASGARQAWEAYQSHPVGLAGLLGAA